MKILTIKSELYESIKRGEFTIPKYITTLKIQLFSAGNGCPLVVNGKSIIPNHITTVIFNSWFGESESQDCLMVNGVKVLPNGVKHVNFGRTFNMHMVINNQRMLPETLETVKFSTDYNHPLRINGINVIPSNVHTVKFGTQFNQDLVMDGELLLPTNLKTLYFGKLFNRPLLYVNTYDKTDKPITIIRAIPDGVKHIDFRKREYYNDRRQPFFSFMEYEGTLLSQFNQTIILNGISAFPQSVESIYFGSSFNQPLTENGVYALPQTLENLCINGPYDYYIPLTESIKYLVLSEDTLHIQIHSYLSQNMVNMSEISSHHKNNNIKKIIPGKINIKIIQSNNDITTYYKPVLTEECTRRQNNINNFMEMINLLAEEVDWKLYMHPMGAYKKFVFSPYPYALLCSSFNYKTVDLHNIEFGIPDSVETVNFGESPKPWKIINDNTMEYDEKTQEYNQSKKRCKLEKKDNSRPIVRLIPDSVKNMNYYNSQTIIGKFRVFPDKLEYIKFGKDFDKSILIDDVSAFPDGIKSVILRRQFNHLIINYPFRAFPDGIKYVRFGHWFNKPVIDGFMRAFPNTTEIIKFGHSFDQPIIDEDVSAFSDGVKEIYFSSKFNQPIIGDGIVAFPNSVTKLVFPPNFKQKIYCDVNANGISPLSLPPHLTSVTINAEYIRQFKYFPDTLNEFNIIPQYYRDGKLKSLPPYNAIKEFRKLKTIEKLYIDQEGKMRITYIIENLLRKLGHTYVEQ